MRSRDGCSTPRRRCRRRSSGCCRSRGSAPSRRCCVSRRRSIVSGRANRRVRRRAGGRVRVRRHLDALAVGPVPGLRPQRALLRHPRARPARLGSDAHRPGTAVRRGRRSGQAHDRPPGSAVPPARVDLPGQGLELHPQALRVAVGRAQQGDEPQQLHRADGRPATSSARRRPGCTCPAGDAAARPRRARLRVRADARRRQRDPARVLPAARVSDGARGAQPEWRSPRRPTARSRDRPRDWS